MRSTRQSCAGFSLLAIALTASLAEAHPAHKDGVVRLRDVSFSHSEIPRVKNRQVIFARDDYEAPKLVDDTKKQASLQFNSRGTPSVSREESFKYQPNRKRNAPRPDEVVQKIFVKRGYSPDDSAAYDSGQPKEHSGKLRGSQSKSPYDDLGANEGSSTDASAPSSLSHPGMKKKKRPLSLDQDPSLMNSNSAGPPQQSLDKSSDPSSGLSGSSSGGSDGTPSDPSMSSMPPTSDQSGAPESLARADPSLLGASGPSTSSAAETPIATMPSASAHSSPSSSNSDASSVKLPDNLKPASPGFLFLPLSGPSPGPAQSGEQGSPTPAAPTRQTLFFNIEAPSGGQMTRFDVPQPTSTDEDKGGSGKKKGCKKNKDKGKGDNLGNSALSEPDAAPIPSGIDSGEASSSDAGATSGASAASSASSRAPMGSADGPASGLDSFSGGASDVSGTKDSPLPNFPSPKSKSQKPREFEFPPAHERLSAHGATLPHADDKFPHVEGDLKPSAMFRRAQLEHNHGEHGIEEPPESLHKRRLKSTPDLSSAPADEMSKRDDYEASEDILPKDYQPYGGFEERTAPPLKRSTPSHGRALTPSASLPQRLHSRMWPATYMRDIQTFSKRRRDADIARQQSNPSKGPTLLKRLLNAGRRDRPLAYWRGEKLR